METTFLPIQSRKYATMPIAFHPMWYSVVICWIVAIVFVVLAAQHPVPDETDPHPQIYVLAALGFLVAGTYSLYSALYEPWASEFELSGDTLIRHGRTEAETLRISINDIESIFVVNVRPGVERFRLILRDGTKVPLNPGTKDVHDLYRQLVLHVRTRHIAEARRAMEVSGQMFGEILMLNRGFRYQGKELSWDEVRRIEIRPDNRQIFSIIINPGGMGFTFWCTQDATKVRNLHTFSELAEEFCQVPVHKMLWP